MSCSGPRLVALSFASSLATLDTDPVQSRLSMCPRCCPASSVTMRSVRSGRRTRRPRSDSEPKLNSPTRQRPPPRIRVNSSTPSLREQLQLVRNKAQETTRRVITYVLAIDAKRQTRFQSMVPVTRTTRMTVFRMVSTAWKKRQFYLLMGTT